MANGYDFIPGDGNDMFWILSGFEFQGNYFIGKSDSGANIDSALRIQNISINQGQSIVSAILNFYVGAKNGSTDLFYRIVGMDEDNTADFTSNPLGRPDTTAQPTGRVALPSVGNGWGANVKSVVEEITQRGGWSNGNSMGFKLYDNGSANGVRFNDAYTGIPAQDAYLQVLLTANPDFYPTETIVTAPAEVLQSRDFGIKIAKREINVLEATDKQINFSTNRPILKCKVFGVSNVEENLITEIPHNMGYKGAFLAWAAPVGGDVFSPIFGRRKKIPAIFYNSDKSSVNVSAYIDTSNLYIEQGSETQEGTLMKYHVYFYIFLDELDS